MLTRPAHLTDADIQRALSEGWAFQASDVEYAAVGYGSHHWYATTGTVRWFVTVDDLDARRCGLTDTRREAGDRLQAALTAACALRSAGLEFAVAPTLTVLGDVTHPVGDRYVVAVYPHIEGDTHEWGAYPTRRDRLAVLDLIAAVHDAPVPPSLRCDDFLIPQRDHLEMRLDEQDLPWGSGPYADPSHDLLQRHRRLVHEVLVNYDQMAAHVAVQSERRVVTHGEPHRGNTINTPDGVVLIDWDTVLLAPPERDLWSLIGEDPCTAMDYAHRTGVDVDRVAVRLYRLWWDLCEVSLSVAALHSPHSDNSDTQLAWKNLNRYLNQAFEHAMG